MLYQSVKQQHTNHAHNYTCSFWYSYFLIITLKRLATKRHPGKTSDQHTSLPAFHTTTPTFYTCKVSPCFH